MSHRPHKRIPAEKLRERFNNGRYWERAQEGEFSEDVIRGDEISPKARRRLDLPAGSHSQIVAYLDSEGRRVALVHQYVRPNLSVRGKPDPKWLLEDGVIYALELRPGLPPPLSEQAESGDGR